MEIWRQRGIRMSAVRTHCLGAARAGLDLEKLLGDASIDIAPDDPEREISRGQHLALMLNIQISLGEETLGQTTDPVRRGFSDIAVRAAFLSPTVAEAIEAYAKFYHRLSGAIRIETRCTQDVWEVRLFASSPNQVQAAAYEEQLATWLGILASWLARDRLAVRQFTVRSPLHPNIGGPHWALDAPTVYGPCTSLQFSTRALTMPCRRPPSDDFIWYAVEQWIGGNEPALPPAIRADATLALRDVAATEHVSGRSLQRHMAAQGQSFRDLRGRAIAERGIQKLLSTDMKIDDIADELGYSDGRSFRRVLRQVTGMAPSEIRLRGALAPPDAALLSRIRTMVKRLHE